MKKEGEKMQSSVERIGKEEWQESITSDHIGESQVSPE